MSVILCTAGYDHTIRFWEALSGICSRTIPHPDSQVNRLCISPDKRFLAAAGHHTVKLYDIKSSNPNPVITFEGHTSNVTGVAFHCEGKWMTTSSEDGTVKIWDTRNGNVQRNYSHGVPVNDVVIHPNQGELISCDRGGNVRVWDLGENKCTHQLIPEDDVPVASVTVASDGSMLCAGNNSGKVYVWNMTQENDSTFLVPVCQFLAHNTYITRVLLSPDVRHLATCSADHTARIWSIDLSAPHNTQNAELLPRERDPAAFPLETTLTGHQRWVWDCAFSADSAYLVTACSDHYARLWELSTEAIIRQYNGHHRGAVCVALNDTALNGESVDDHVKSVVGYWDYTGPEVRPASVRMRYEVEKGRQRRREIPDPMAHGINHLERFAPWDRLDMGGHNPRSVTGYRQPDYELREPLQRFLTNNEDFTEEFPELFPKLKPKAISHDSGLQALRKAHRTRPPIDERHDSAIANSESSMTSKMSHSVL